MAALGRGPLRVLLCSDERAYTSEQQLQPFRQHRRLLRQRGVVFLESGIGMLLGSPRFVLGHFDVVAAKLSYQSSVETVQRVIDVFRGLRGRCLRVYFDGDDDSCVQWPEMAGAVDAYVKKHMFSDPARYAREYVGKSNLTDYVHRTHGFSFESDPIRHTRPLSQEEIKSLRLGWNLSQDEKIVKLWQGMKSVAAVPRTVDVVCRASAQPESWIYPLRRPVVSALEELAKRRPILLPTQKVTQEQYNQEMLSSRICISPFGYGEICWRDFEAIACGCLLVKPDMSHVRTRPDIFVPGQTYVPVRWDFSDLAETCERYLDQPVELARIVAAARTALDDWYNRERVVDCIVEILQEGKQVTARGV